MKSVASIQGDRLSMKVLNSAPLLSKLRHSQDQKRKSWELKTDTVRRHPVFHSEAQNHSKPESEGSATPV